MPRQKKRPVPNPLIAANYDSHTLVGAVEILERSLGWEALKEFIYYQAAVHRTMSNVLVQQTGKQYEACAAGAKAEALLEVADRFLDQLKDKVQGNTGIVEDVRPEQE